MRKTAIVIPYYQKKPGILRRALEAAARQQGLPADADVAFIVVDDGSPVAPEPEIDGIAFPAGCRAVIVRQENGGVGAARNTGLRNLPPDTGYVGFLDSDDIWDPAYLGQAVAALDRGYDCFFCDNLRLGEPLSGFQQKDFAAHLASPDARPVGGGLYELDKEPFFDKSLRGRVFHISGLLYRREIAPGLSFDTSLKYAGEDCLFLFHLLSKCRRICCTPQLLVTCADGVNIYASRNGWDNPGHMTRNMCQLLAFYKWQEQLPLSEGNARFVARRIEIFRKLFAFLTVRHFIKFRKFWPPELVELVRADAGFYRWYPLYAVYVALGYGLSFYDPLREW